MIETAAIATVLLLGAVGMIVLLTLYGALVLWVLWGWFIVPLGAPQIGIAWAIGIALVANLLAPTPAPAASEKDAKQHVTTSLLKPAVALAIGWVAKQFM
jgi:hypothetical protein